MGSPHIFRKKNWCKVVALELKKVLTFLLKLNLKPNHYPKARIRPMKNVKCEEISFWSKCIKVNETGTVWCFLVYLQSTCVDWSPFLEETINYPHPIFNKHHRIICFNKHPSQKSVIMKKLYNCNVFEIICFLQNRKIDKPF